MGDTDSTDPQLQDGEVDGLLNANTPGGSTNPDPYLAAVQACLSLASRYARRADKTTGDLTISYANISKGYYELAAEIKVQAMRHSAVPVPYAGGLTFGDRSIDEENDDLVHSFVSVGFTDNEGALVDDNSNSAFEIVVPE